jgi:hypothetical protein
MSSGHSPLESISSLVTALLTITKPNEPACALIGGIFMVSTSLQSHLARVAVLAEHGLQHHPLQKDEALPESATK